MLCLTSLPLAAAEVARGVSVLLVAAEEMQDPRFRHSVVLVTRHGSSGATVGVIVNRAFEIPLDRLFPQIGAAARHRLHYGGPVAEGELVFLVRGDPAPPAAIVVADRLYLDSDIEGLVNLLGASTPASRLRVFSGFASWSPGQLEDEIRRGDWHLLPVDAEALFSDSLEDLWPRLWRRATQVMVRAAVPAAAL